MLGRKVSDEPVVRTENLCRIYRMGARRIAALQGVDLALRAGTLAVVRGRSGSGKTTLLNCIAGLDRPTSGQVWVDGREIGSLSPRQLVSLRRHVIGFVFQSQALMPTYSAVENVDLALRLAGVSRLRRGRRAQQLLARVGLEKWMHHRPYELSGGQQQRVSIARALAAEPALILADEPTGELDTATGQQILQLLRRVALEHGAAVLVASHDPAVTAVADSMYHLQDGRLISPTA